MLKRKIDKVLYNPVFGLFPILLLIYLILLMPVHRALDLSLSVCAIMFVAFVWLLGRKVFQSFIVTSLTSLLFFNLVMFFLSEDFVQKNAVVLIESVFFVDLLVIKIFENRIHHFVDNNLKIGLKIHLKPALQMYFFVSKLFLVFLPLHILALILFRYFFPHFETDSSLFWIRDLLSFVIIVVGVVEFLNLRWIGSKINMERYLPIIDPNSRVIGHIAMSESVSFEKKFLHPMVRIAFKYDKKLYLRERPLSFRYEVGKMCLPIEDYVNYGENLDEAVKRVIQHHFGKAKIHPRFLLKYSHEEVDRKCLNYLYLINLDNEKTLHVKDLKGGKWWTEMQIEENIGKGYFSSTFESEFDYIQTTVLMADKYEPFTNTNE